MLQTKETVKMGSDADFQGTADHRAWLRSSSRSGHHPGFQVLGLVKEVSNESEAAMRRFPRGSFLGGDLPLLDS